MICSKSKASPRYTAGIWKRNVRQVIDEMSVKEAPMIIWRHHRLQKHSEMFFQVICDVIAWAWG